MGLRPTHSDESALLSFIDSKRVTHDFRRSEMAIFSPTTAANPHFRSLYRSLSAPFGNRCLHRLDPLLYFLWTSSRDINFM